MSVKTKTIRALFVALVIILAVKPSLINDIYNHILGRLLLVGLVIFMSMNNVTLGLLVALAVIAVTNQFNPFVEGMENGSSTTIGDDNAVTKGSKIVLTKEASKDLVLTSEQQEAVKQRLSDLRDKNASAGVDIESIKNAIMSKDSKTIPVDSGTKESEEVSAFTTGMLGRSSLGGSLTQTTGRVDGSWMGSPSGIKMGQPSKGSLGQQAENSTIGWLQRVGHDIIGRPLGGSGNHGTFS